MTSLHHKAKRLNIVDLKRNHPEDFGRFVMALKNLQDSDDWYRICGIHGNTFKPNDPKVLCPTDPNVVKELAETGEPVYCKHKVSSFIAWHVPYIYQFELLLNKYNHSNNKNYIALPYLDLTNFNSDFSFLNEPKISITYHDKKTLIDNPLASAYYYVDGVKTKITRGGYLTPTNKAQLTQLKTIKKQLNNSLYATFYEKFSSELVSFNKLNQITNYVPLETPHNTLHDVIGGDNGNMSDISISAFDPIFWLHHCNMDRHFYTWLYENTNHFNTSIYPNKISETVYNSTQAPFFKPKFYDVDFNNYKYGWENSSTDFMLLKDTLNVRDLPYTYAIIQPTPYREVKSFIELIDIPIPMETVTISVYIHSKNEQLNKDIHFAGSGTWFGLNRTDRFCERCQVTRTNIKIDLDEYVNENKITKDTLDNYNVIIEGKGRLIKKESGYSAYSLEEIIKDGTYAIVI
jgi:hypothetical protein